MDEMKILVNQDQMYIALTKLICDLVEQQRLQDNDCKTLWDLVEKLDTTTFSTLHKNVYFADFLRQISFRINKNDLVENEVEQSHGEHLNRDLKNDITEQNKDLGTHRSVGEAMAIFPSLSTPLETIELPNRFLKLIKRLRNASLDNPNFSLGDTLEDVVSLDENYISNFNGVGAMYIELLKELKEGVAAQNGCYKEKSEDDEEFDYLTIDTSNYLISMAGVDERFVKPLAKYARYIKQNDMTRQVDEVLGFKRDELRKLPSFGQGVVNTLMEFKSIIKTEVHAIVKGEIDYSALQSKIIVPANIEYLPLGQLEKVLLEDIDDYLAKLSDDDVDIIQSRWGLVDDKETLEDLGDRYSVTRERIRQRVVGINSRFLLNLRINPKTLWFLLEPHLQPDLKGRIPDLFNCFSSEKAFYEFLEITCQKESLLDYVYPQLDKSFLNKFFAQNGAPIHIQYAMEVIEEEIDDLPNTLNALKNLQQQDVLVIEGEHIWPKYLGKSEASACVLASHPKGLPWSDVARLANANGYPRTDIYEDRLDNDAFKNKDYIYLAEKGVYRHTRYINFDVNNIEKVFEELSAYKAFTSSDVFHLNECYQSSEYLKLFDYYEIRHFVKHFGENYGFYFDGRSQADSVGRKIGFKNITQKEVVIRAMNARDKPFTKPEIAGLLKSKSLVHASFYLDGLYDEGRVVQVDRQLYTTPEQAYRNIDLSEYLNAMQSILEKHSKPVEASIFQKTLNSMLSVSYSKYFYLSIARYFIAEKGWYRAHGLYSIEPIPFNNLTEALNNYCKMDDPIEDSVERLQQHIAITKSAALQNIHNWRSSRIT